MGRARREICCFCYGWLLPTHPDPDGYHLVAVKRYLRSREGAHVQALYWDYACVMQPPRTTEETAAFSDAIQTVADLYSSPLASCVLRNPFVPPRPDALDGVLALHHVSPRVTGSKLAQVLGSLGGTVKALHYDATFKLWRATLAYHQEAEKVVAGILKARHAFRTAEPGVSPGRLPIAVAALGRDMVATPWYNDRQLTGRAWTVFESNLAVEVTMCSCCFMLLRTQRRRPSPRPLVEHSAHTHHDFVLCTWPVGCTALPVRCVLPPQALARVFHHANAGPLRSHLELQLPPKVVDLVNPDALAASPHQPPVGLRPGPDVRHALPSETYRQRVKRVRGAIASAFFSGGPSEHAALREAYDSLVHVSRAHSSNSGSGSSGGSGGSVGGGSSSGSATAPLPRTSACRCSRFAFPSPLFCVPLLSRPPPPSPPSVRSPLSARSPVCLTLPLAAHPFCAAAQLSPGRRGAARDGRGSSPRQ